MELPQKSEGDWGSHEGRLGHYPGLGGRTLEPVPSFVLAAGSSQQGASCPTQGFFIWELNLSVLFTCSVTLGESALGLSFSFFEMGIKMGQRAT